MATSARVVREPAFTLQYQRRQNVDIRFKTIYRDGDRNQMITEVDRSHFRVDFQNHIWGICDDQDTNCQLEGVCIDGFNCVDICGPTDKSLPTLFWYVMLTDHSFFPKLPCIMGLLTCLQHRNCPTLQYGIPDAHF